MTFDQAQDFHEAIRNKANALRAIADACIESNDYGTADLLRAEARGMIAALCVFWEVHNAKAV